MDRLYIDCNILLDWLAERQPFAAAAELVISDIEERKAEGYVSPLTLANTYYLVSHHLNKKVASSFLKDCRRLFAILDITREHTLSAIGTLYKDFEDDLHYQVATANKLTAIITRNKDDFPKGGITIMDAEEYLRKRGPDRPQTAS